MVIRVDLLIYIYIILCACMLAFDLLYLRKDKPDIKHWSKKVEQCKGYIDAISSEEGAAKNSAKKALKRKLHRRSFLMAFHDTVMKLLQDEETTAIMVDWIYHNDDLFLEIKEDYMDSRRSNHKAFYAYLVWQYGLCGSDSGRTFVSMMQLLVLERSIYCRENALWAIYTGGSAEDVVKAYRLMVSNDIIHSQKLITDGLLAFRGNHQQLFEELWKYRKEFSPYYGVGFINYIRMASSGFEKRFFGLLQNSKADREVRIAIIRYFRSHPYEEAMIYLREVVRNWGSYDWEFVAQAALTLEKDIQSDDTITALLQGCHSTNWYIRKNSAESLLQVKDESLLRLIVTNEDDRYARDMIQYKLERKKD